MKFGEINPDDLPDGHPIKQIIEAAAAASRRMDDEVEINRDKRNQLVFDFNNELRDKARDEIEWMRTIETIVRSTDKVMKYIMKNPHYIQADVLRAISDALLSKADEMDHMLAKHKEINKEMHDKINERDSEQ